MCVYMVDICVDIWWIYVCVYGGYMCVYMVDICVCMCWIYVCVYGVYGGYMCVYGGYMCVYMVDIWWIYVCVYGGYMCVYMVDPSLLPCISVLFLILLSKSMTVSCLCRAVVLVACLCINVPV